MPKQRSQRSIIFGDGILADAVEMISESAVRAGSSYRNEDCDLAVAVNPDNNTLKEAYSYLEPGGSVYIEWILNPFSRSALIKEKMEAVGFQNVTFYMPKPDPSKLPTEIWIPLVKNVVVDYLKRFSRENTREHVLKQLRKVLRRILLFLSPKLFVTFPGLICSGLKQYKLCSIASKSITGGVITNNVRLSGTGEPETTDNITNVIESCLNSLALYDKSKEISILMLTERGGFEKVILFVYTEMNYNPAFVIKLPRTDEPGSSLKKEATVLSALQKRFEEIEGVPKILFDGYESGISTIGETFITGNLISNIITESNYRELALKMTVWLSEFAQKTKISSPQDLKDDYKKQIISSFVKSYSAVLNSAQIKQIYNVLEELEPKYRVCVHNDLGLWNVLINSGGELGIIDWDAGNLNGFPLTDLIMFFTWLSFQIEQTYKLQQYRRSYRNMLDSSTFTGKVFKECLTRYADKLDIPLSDIPAYRLLTLLIQAEIELPHLIPDIQNSDGAMMSLEKGFYIQLIKEELLHFNKFELSET